MNACKTKQDAPVEYRATVKNYDYGKFMQPLQLSCLSSVLRLRRCIHISS